MQNSGMWKHCQLRLLIRLSLPIEPRTVMQSYLGAKLTGQVSPHSMAWRSSTPSSPEWSESNAWNTCSTQACHSSLSCTARQSSMAATQLSYLQIMMKGRCQIPATVPALQQGQVLLSHLQGNLSREVPNIYAGTGYEDAAPPSSPARLPSSHDACREADWLPRATSSTGVEECAANAAHY